MRISDWSSDVCSSDLLQRAFIFTLLQHLARTTVPESDDLQPDVNAGEVAPAVAPIPAQAPTLILAIEEPELYQHPTKQRHFADVLRGWRVAPIGRASCRERVCQYV